MEWLTPPEVAANMTKLAVKKSATPLGKLLCLGALAGAYIALAANLYTIVVSDATKYVGFGLGQVLGGAVFSLGLVLVLIAGGELFTGNNMVMTIGALDGSVSWAQLVRNWVMVFGSNFVGAISVVALLAVGFYGTGGAQSAAGLANGSVGAKAILVANAKLQLTWQAAFARAVLCNWLVCVAVWIAASSKDVTGKIIACSLPVMAFVASGFEHSIANMFFVPMGMVAAKIPSVLDLAAKSLVAVDGVSMETARAGLSESLSWGTFVVRNLIPVTLGNVVGGAVLVGAAYWLAYLKKAPVAQPVTSMTPVAGLPDLRALYATTGWGDMSDI